jgi:broad specificity phosphatase PhoE
MLAALYTGGKLVTGVNHGDAFSKLTEQEKEDCNSICSGFVDLNTMKFISDDGEFYLKQIIMIRHADSEGQQDNSKLTDLGRCQANEAAAFLLAMSLQGFVPMCSPVRRCIETAIYIQRYCKIRFTIKQDLRKQVDGETPESFNRRVQLMLDCLPAKTLIVSHCDFIHTMLTLSTRGSPSNNIPNCSISYVKDGRALCIGRQLDASNCKKEDYEPRKIPEGLEFV